MGAKSQNRSSSPVQQSRNGYISTNIPSESLNCHHRGKHEGTTELQPLRWIDNSHSCSAWKIKSPCAIPFSARAGSTSRSDTGGWFRTTHVKCIRRPPAIDRKAFYQAFNRISADLHLERREKKIPITYPPVLFNLDGKVIDIQAKDKNQLKNLFEMPSSCKDIRTLQFIFFCISKLDRC